jgi:Skp family chaperone for outer membrane proteins
MTRPLNLFFLVLSTYVHTAVQVDMERRLEEVEQQELSARCAQEEAASLLSAQQEKHDAETARLQEELAQALASLRQMEEQERANRAQTQSNFEDQMREMQVEYEKRTSEREAEWSGKSLPASPLRVGVLSSKPDAHRLCMWLPVARRPLQPSSTACESKWTLRGSSAWRSRLDHTPQPYKRRKRCGPVQSLSGCISSLVSFATPTHGCCGAC